MFGLEVERYEHMGLLDLFVLLNFEDKQVCSLSHPNCCSPSHSPGGHIRHVFFSSWRTRIWVIARRRKLSLSGMAP